MHTPQFLKMLLARRLIALGGVSFANSRSTQYAFVFQRRRVDLPPRQQLSVADDGSLQSVTGPIYDMPYGPKVKLFTKEGCTLCDKVKDVSVQPGYACKQLSSSSAAKDVYAAWRQGS